MEELIQMRTIALIHTDFSDKFGIPRQSGLVPELEGMIRFMPEYRSADSVRGLEGFSHLWLIWQFSKAVREDWSPTVRPPRLGGNKRIGVFATRSPFRPNSIGLSCVRLKRIEYHPDFGPQIYVSGADLLDGTPILDIKPYLAYADSHPDAVCGFTQTSDDFLLQVDFPPAMLEAVAAEKRSALLGVLSHDPRPSYQDDPDRVYGMDFAGYNIRFRVIDHILTVLDVLPIKNKPV